jgi:hypothetical protein
MSSTNITNSTSNTVIENILSMNVNIMNLCDVLITSHERLVEKVNELESRLQELENSKTEVSFENFSDEDEDEDEDGT